MVDYAAPLPLEIIERCMPDPLGTTAESGKPDGTRRSFSNGDELKGFIDSLP